jgi:PAS domain S-box-containing protein
LQSGSIILVWLANPANMEVASRLLQQADLHFRACPDIDSLLTEAARDADALLIEDSGLTTHAGDKLTAFLDRQPAWSQLPVILLVRRAMSTGPGTPWARLIRNLIVVERPIAAPALVSVLRTALKDRQRQYEVRDLLINLQELNRTLEQRVADRTARLEQANTELQQTHAHVLASRAFLQSILDAVPETTLVIDRDYRVVLANRAARQMAGGKDPVVACLKCHELSHHRQTPCQGKLDHCPLEEVLASKAPVTVTHTNYDAQNNEIFVEVTASPILDDKGEVIQIVEACRDITERKRAEEALRESGEQYRSLFEHMLDGYAYCRMIYENGLPHDFVYLSVNSAFERLTGLKDVVGKNVSEVIPGIEGANRELFQVYGRVASTGQSERFETYLESLGIWFSISVYSPRKDHFVAVFDDITARKQSEGALRQAAVELARSNRDLAQFANVTSHDLQEPLRMVTGFLKLFVERSAAELDDKDREYINFAVDGADRMSLLITDLLAYSRVGREGKGFVQTDLEAVLAHALLNLQISIGEAQAVITHDPLPTVKAETSLITQLFQNLIGNAIKYRAEGVKPEIHIGAKREGRGWQFCVRDNGIGIKAQDREAVFMIFRRLHTREEYPGTGIGLAICKRIVEHHCGRIWVESEPGKGSTFYFTIPDRDGPA